LTVIPYRSLLFVPGHRKSWADKAVASGADALIFDLEDSVPLDLKAEARSTVAETIERLASSDTGPGLVVRPNAWDTGLAGLDLEAVVGSGLDAVFLPKIKYPNDIIRYDAVLEHCEIKAGVPVGQVEIIATLETAPGVANCEAIALSSPRVRCLVGGGARGADQARAIGYQWSPEGLETLFIRSKVLLASRAADLDHAVASIWQDIDDLEGLERWARSNRSIGYRGQVLIHPSHVQLINDVYGPSDVDVAHYNAMIEAFEEAERAGAAAVKFRGQHIDLAHVKSAQGYLDWAASIGKQAS
jgi:citrate lyase subunit beta / citryl-CoA lyase